MRRSQELEFRVGVGEWKVVFLFKVFNAEAQRRKVRRDFYGCLRQGSVRRSQGLGVRNWSSFRVFSVFRGSYQPRTPYSRQLRRATSRHKTLEFYRSSTVQAAQSSSISGTGGWLIVPPPHAKKFIRPSIHAIPLWLNLKLINYCLFA